MFLQASMSSKTGNPSLARDGFAWLCLAPAAAADRIAMMPCGREFGKKVHMWITFNESNVMVRCGPAPGQPVRSQALPARLFSHL